MSNLQSISFLQHTASTFRLCLQRRRFAGPGPCTWRNFALGKVSFAEAGDANKDKFRESREFLLEAVEPLKAQGGQNYGMLAYFLGICYVKLDVDGDNLTQATQWMGVAAGIEGPVQAQATDILSKIKASQE